MKCSLVHEECPARAAFEYAKDCCEKYRDSTIIYRDDNPHYSKCVGRENGKISMTYSPICRYYGIERAKELEAEFAKNGDEF